MVRFSTAYYGRDRSGRAWVATLCREWIDPDTNQRGASTEVRIPCSDETKAKAAAYGFKADAVRAIA